MSVSEVINKVSVILPTYNEKGNIVPLVTNIIENLSNKNVEKEIIVVDDNSPDQTGILAKDTFSGDETIKVFIRTNEKGFASAIRYGIEHSTGDILIVMDTDFNHDPKMIPQMIDLLKYYDIIIGSRYVMNGGMEDHFRYLGSYLYNIFLRQVLRTQIQDNTCGFFSIRRNRLFALNFDKIFFGYGDYFFRLLFYAKNHKYGILEIPVYYQLRKSGESKTSLLPVLGEYTVAALKLRYGYFKNRG